LRERIEPRGMLPSQRLQFGLNGLEMLGGCVAGRGTDD